MNPLPPQICTFLDEHHVLSLAVCRDNIPWAASAFFAFDALAARLLFLSDSRTQHGQIVQTNGLVAGTVAGQPRHIGDIQGVQFQGVATLLEEGRARQLARERYDARFPFAKAVSDTAPPWEIRLLRVKFTDNRQTFGAKLHWERHTAAPGGNAA
ncbi:MAG: pyridoxamine 5'-phosphate oxidase family protein [Rhodocyclaceae bacterium]